MSIGKLKRFGLPFSNVAANNTATASITRGKTLETIRFKLGGTSLPKASLTLIRVKVNAKACIEISGSELEKLNVRKGKPSSANYLDLDLADFKLNNEYDRMIGAWDTSQGVENISVEVSIGAATAPTLQMILIESARQKAVNGDVAPFAALMTKIIRMPFNVSAGGKLAVQFPFERQGTIIKRAHFLHNGQLVGLTIKQDGVVIYESLRADNEYDEIALGYVPQTNMYSADFVSDGNITKSLDTRDVLTLEVIPEFAAADNGTIILEVIDPLGNL